MACALGAGCKSSPPASSDIPARAASKSGGKSSSKNTGKAQASEAAPINETIGKIASVNPGLRFAVVDFSLGELPPEGQRMSIYREGQKVGELKISGPSRNKNIAADIVAGEARTGDEVRPF